MVAFSVRNIATRKRRSACIYAPVWRSLTRQRCGPVVFWQAKATRSPTSAPKADRAGTRVVAGGGPRRKDRCAGDRGGVQHPEGRALAQRADRPGAAGCPVGPCQPGGGGRAGGSGGPCCIAGETGAALAPCVSTGSHRANQEVSFGHAWATRTRVLGTS